jgi:hypothetical protein
MFRDDTIQRTVAVRLAGLFIIAGLLLAIDSALSLSVVPRMWPLLVTALGIGLVGMYHRRRGREPAFLAAGAYLICFSLLALYCSFTSWASLVKLWPLFIAFAGVALIAHSRLSRQRRSSLLLGLLLLSVAATFIVVLAAGPGYWWVLLVLIGGSILVSETRR